MIHVGNIKGVVWQNLISRLSKICEICENKATRKFPSIRYII